MSTTWGIPPNHRTWGSDASPPGGAGGLGKDRRVEKAEGWREREGGGTQRAQRKKETLGCLRSNRVSFTTFQQLPGILG